MKHYDEGTIRAFNGYDTPSTKDTTHICQSQGKVGKAVVVFRNMILNMRKDDLLLNIANKQNFLKILVEKMSNSKIQCIHSYGDADTLITPTTVQSSRYKANIVIGEDTDLVILLLFHANIECENIYFTSQKTTKKKEQDVWSITDAKVELGQELCKSILLHHGQLGCDNTLRLFNVVKSVTCFQRIPT